MPRPGGNRREFERDRATAAAYDKKHKTLGFTSPNRGAVEREVYGRIERAKAKSKVTLSCERVFHMPSRVAYHENRPATMEGREESIGEYCVGRIGGKIVHIDKLLIYERPKR